jgi:hypothetical protein
MAILLLCFTMGHSYVYGQESYVKGKWNIKAGYSKYGFGSWTNQSVKENITGHYRLETNYGFFNAIEAGAYFAYSEIDSPVGRFDSDPTWFYGLNLNLHPLDHFFHFDKPRLDIYVTGRFGFRNYNGNHGEYSIGGGLVWYWGRYFGVYMENTYGNHGAFQFYDNHLKQRYGISIRF